MNFKAVLVLPKTAGSAHTHKSISFIWIVWSTLYMYISVTTHYIFLLLFCPTFFSFQKKNKCIFARELWMLNAYKRLCTSLVGVFNLVGNLRLTWVKIFWLLGQVLSLLFFNINCNQGAKMNYYYVYTVVFLQSDYS